jgi:TatD DNase family protein
MLASASPDFGGGLVDIGVNLAGPALAPHHEKVVQECRDADVRCIVCVSNDMACSAASARLCDLHPVIAKCTLGVHPKEAASVRAKDLAAFVTELRALVLATPACVAIGECGLSCTTPTSKPKNSQVRVFAAQVQLAKELGLPLYLHCRNAHEQVVQMLRDAAYSRGVVHCFTGTPAQARTYVDMGLHIGITGWVADGARSADLVAALSGGAVPLDRLLIETDAPWLSVEPGRPSTPADVWPILRLVAGHMGVDVEAARVAVVRNFRRLFLNAEE